SAGVGFVGSAEPGGSVKRPIAALNQTRERGVAIGPVDVEKRRQHASGREAKDGSTAEVAATNGRAVKVPIFSEDQTIQRIRSIAAVEGDERSERAIRRDTESAAETNRALLGTSAEEAAVGGQNEPALGMAATRAAQSHQRRYSLVCRKAVHK